MSYATLSPGTFASYEGRRPSSRSPLRTACAAAAMTAVTLGGTWLLLARLPVEVARTPDRPLAVSAASVPAPVASRRATAARMDKAWLAPAYSLGFDPGSFADNEPLAAVLDDPPVVVADAEPEILPIPTPPVPAVVQSVPVDSLADVPLPMPRPSDVRVPTRRGPVHALGPQVAQGGPSIPVPTGPGDTRTFLEKFFGLGQQSGSALGYAAPEDGFFGGPRMLAAPPSSYDRWTAVYEIATHTVYMPGGARLEAHSGLGAMQDDPRHVNARNRGPTPPHIYDLTPREALFHGVQALRLNPVGGGGVFGRTGLLAHTYMLGATGASNGCVSFRDYNAFLQAFRRGEIRRLAVVARLT